MNVFGVGLPEIAVIGALALIVFGPKKLPELGRTLGKTLKGFQTASSEFEREMQKAMSNPEPLDSRSELETTIPAQDNNSLNGNKSEQQTKEPPTL